MFPFTYSSPRIFLVAAMLALPTLYAQSSSQPATSANSTARPNNDPDGEVVGDPPSAPQTPAQLREGAWNRLVNSVADSRQSDVRIQALAALGLMGGNHRSLKLIETAIHDPDVDVQTAALLAAGETGSPAIWPAVHMQMNSKEPQVAYTAALTLWKMGNHSGEDILTAVIDGERKASANVVDGTEHDIDKTLHSPSELAKIGMMQGAGLLLGPFGFGITAYEYIKKNGGDSTRVTAIEALSQQKSPKIRKALLAALGDKDLGVRAAAAKALDSYHQPEVSEAIAKLMNDPKKPVRLTASAAYLISTRASQASRQRPARRR
jgi:HEAT repeat protein